MKSIITITVLALFFSFQTFSQVIKPKEVFCEKFTLERLEEIHKSKTDDLKRLNNKKTFLLKLNSSQVKQLFNNQQIEFYEEKELDGNHSITTITKKQLDSGFLLIESLTQTWEGNTWINAQKDSYTYDVNNNRIGGLGQTWDGSLWINSGKVSAAYDGNNNPIELVFQSWGGSNWMNELRYAYAYDGNNNLIESFSQTGSGVTWVNDYRDLYTYNENNNWIESLSQIWDDSLWISYGKDSATYDGNNNLIEDLSQTWSGGIWVNDSKYSFTYDENNNEIEYLCQDWLGGAWVNYKKYSYIYDGNNNWIEYLYQTWSGNAWINSWKYSFIYDVNNNCIEHRYQTWSGSGWVNNNRYLMAYDVNNNRIESAHQTWSSSVWVNDYKYDYSYDENNNPMVCVYQIWSGSIWNNSEKYIYTYMPELPVELVSFNAEMVDGNVVLNWSTATETNNNGFQVQKASSSTTPIQGWEDKGFVSGKGTTTERTFYSYTEKNEKPGTYLYRLKQTDFDGTFSYSNEIEVEVSAPRDFALYQNYPNPFNPSTTIKFALPVKTNLTVGVYNTLGEKVAEIFNGELEEGYHEMMFNASGLSSGVYYYKIESENFNSTKKLMLLK